MESQTHAVNNQNRDFAFFKKVVVEVDENAPPEDGLFKNLIKGMKKDEVLLERENSIKEARSELKHFNTTIHDLNRNIQKLEQITEKWKEKGSTLDFKR